MSQSRERLMQTLQELGILAKRSLGQNFLVSDLVIERIINQVKEFAPEELIEVGPGPGALTYFLRQMNVPLQLIELDSKIAAYWKEQGLEVLEEDALQLDWSRFFTGKKIVFVSNLPYQISSSIVIERSLEANGVEHMVLMFQKEVAQRIRAPAKNEHYGLLSVIAQVFWKTAMVTEAGPRDFDPPPRVASRVLSFSRLPTEISNRKAFLTFVKTAFAQRRKLLKSNLSGLLKQKQLTEEQLVSLLAELGFKETARAEELSPQQFVTVFKKLGFDT
ncbi:16S rRNA (adenine(1518)-N(6)/adenine(1519)-N(6))-dimethyltransferase RsmA [Bdellovibrio reynosensis]|uniref:Ribosomal RNA small subunit methyltransferase A n=1 Tax=Bdellovibrio reynosensis TaxID=2835041 RepID=A0ABY4CCB7_9BACT|nr:16S rRNA (adenine(1518)-N(6)/adenine(1519)-N(6))-dimethyltransferase RsmA [Bdellovibrio reynosensis]UOE99844.1 16S rRNA (adenine(1518)-N(6)/adenine(1519)-N(6))-dimethyltransferase RsmA [Bdellovibrio reynosensis]